MTKTFPISFQQVIKEKRQEWDQLLETKAKIIADCAHFGIKEPDFAQLEEVQLDLEKHEEMWGLFEEFNTSMGEMVKEEWIIFRFHTHMTFTFPKYLHISISNGRRSKLTSNLC